MQKMMWTLMLSVGMVATANAEYWRDSGGSVVTNDYDECFVDSQGTWNETDIDAMLACGDAVKQKTVLRIPSNDVPGGNINFAFDSTVLDDRALATITAINDQVPEHANVSVIGYTDAVGDDEYNMELGMQRAIIVAERLPYTNIEVASMGEQLLVVKTQEPNRENRFVEVVAQWEVIVRKDR